MRFSLPALVVLLAVLAGCSGSPSNPLADDAPGLDVTDSTGGIRGIVVDAAVMPVAGAEVTLSGGATATSGSGGLFNFTGLEPGTYVLSASKPGYTSYQTATEVVAGVSDPPIVKILLERLTSAQPYIDHFKLDGYYECGFSANTPLFLITDTCDFAVRTAYDGVNETSGSPPPLIPRNVQRGYNTQYIDLLPDTWTVIQEAFWNDETVPSLMILLSSTPIDNACDCSEDDYLDVAGGSPTYGRLDLLNEDGTTEEPAGFRVAARGFLDWETTQTAQNLEFVIITTLFHNYVPAEGWTFETKDQYPIG